MTSESVESLKKKLNKLAVEYQRLKSKNSVLKRAVLQEKAANDDAARALAAAREEVYAKSGEVERLSAANSRLSKRCDKLMAQAKQFREEAKRAGNPSFLGSLLLGPGGSAEQRKLAEELAVMQEELASKISEAARVSSEMYAKDEEHKSTLETVQAKLDDLKRGLAERTDALSEARDKVTALQAQLEGQKVAATEEIERLRTQLVHAQERTREREEDMGTTIERQAFALLELRARWKEQVAFDDAERDELNAMNLPRFDRDVMLDKVRLCGAARVLFHKLRGHVGTLIKAMIERSKSAPEHVKHADQPDQEAAHLALVAMPSQIDSQFARLLERLDWLKEQLSQQAESSRAGVQAPPADNDGLLSAVTSLIEGLANLATHQLDVLEQTKHPRASYAVVGRLVEAYRNLLQLLHDGATSLNDVPGLRDEDTLPLYCNPTLDYLLTRPADYLQQLRHRVTNMASRFAGKATVDHRVQHTSAAGRDLNNKIFSAITAMGHLVRRLSDVIEEYRATAVRSLLLMQNSRKQQLAKLAAAAANTTGLQQDAAATSSPTSAGSDSVSHGSDAADGGVDGQHDDTANGYEPLPIISVESAFHAANGTPSASPRKPKASDSEAPIPSKPVSDEDFEPPVQHNLRALRRMKHRTQDYLRTIQSDPDFPGDNKLIVPYDEALSNKKRIIRLAERLAAVKAALAAAESREKNTEQFYKAEQQRTETEILERDRRIDELVSELDAANTRCDELRVEKARLREDLDYSEAQLEHVVNQMRDAQAQHERERDRLLAELEEAAALAAEASSYPQAPLQPSPEPPTEPEQAVVEESQPEAEDAEGQGGGEEEQQIVPEPEEQAEEAGGGGDEEPAVEEPPVEQESAKQEARAPPQQRGAGSVRGRLGSLLARRSQRSRSASSGRVVDDDASGEGGLYSIRGVAAPWTVATGFSAGASSHKVHKITDTGGRSAWQHDTATGSGENTHSGFQPPEVSILSMQMRTAMEEFRREEYESQLQQLRQQLYAADERATHFHFELQKMAGVLRHCFTLQRLAKEKAVTATQRSQTLQDDLNATKVNYERMMQELTEHVCNLTERLAQADAKTATLQSKLKQRREKAAPRRRGFFG